MIKDNEKHHKLFLGLGLIIFSVVLWLSSPLTALETNLNWPAAFFVLGLLTILKAIIFPCKK